jgi:hypothetical protein
VNRLVWADVMRARIEAARAELVSLETSLAYHLQRRADEEARAARREADHASWYGAGEER